MKETYLEMKKRHSEALDAFPMFFAFSKEQYIKGKEKLGVTSDDDIVSVWCGGFVRKSDADAFVEMMESQTKELEHALHTDDDFLYKAMVYKLRDTEAGYTGEMDDALNQLGLTKTELARNKHMATICQKAMDYVMGGDSE